MKVEEKKKEFPSDRQTGWILLVGFMGIGFSVGSLFFGFVDGIAVMVTVAFFEILLIMQGGFSRDTDSILAGLLCFLIAMTGGWYVLETWNAQAAQAQQEQAAYIAAHTFTYNGTVTDARSWTSKVCSWLGNCSEQPYQIVTIAYHNTTLTKQFTCNYYQAGDHVTVVQSLSYHSVSNNTSSSNSQPIFDFMPIVTIANLASGC